jgi:glutamine---fructose-6-phosphate transaminase (isomerizing)
MVDEDMFSLFFMPSRRDPELYRATQTAIEEVKARNGKVIAFCTEDDTKLRAMLDHALIIPDSDPDLLPLIQLVMAQLFSYYSALDLGLNIDKPRNLAKSVTVG